MRTTVHITVLAFFVALLVAFATTPSVAEMSSNPAMDQPGMAGEYQGKSVKKDIGFAGEAKSGAAGEAQPGVKTKSGMMDEKKAGEFGRKKDPMKGEAKGEVEKKPEGFFPSATGPGVPGKGAAGMMEKRVPGMKERGAAEKREFPAASKGGEAIVFRVDRPDNCLRVRSEPSSSADRIACVRAGERVRLTGVFSPDGRWAQLDNNGWVFFSQLQTDVRPPESMGRTWRQPAGAGGGKGGRAYRHGSHCNYGGYYYPYSYSYSYYPGYYYSYPRYYRGGFFGFPGFFY